MAEIIDDELAKIKAKQLAARAKALEVAGPRTPVPVEKMSRAAQSAATEVDRVIPMAAKTPVVKTALGTVARTGAKALTGKAFGVASDILMPSEANAGEGDILRRALPAPAQQVPLRPVFSDGMQFNNPITNPTKTRPFLPAKTAAPSVTAKPAAPGAVTTPGTPPAPPTPPAEATTGYRVIRRDGQAPILTNSAKGNDVLATQLKGPATDITKMTSIPTVASLTAGMTTDQMRRKIISMEGPGVNDDAGPPVFDPKTGGLAEFFANGIAKQEYYGRQKAKDRAAKIGLDTEQSKRQNDLAAAQINQANAGAERDRFSMTPEAQAAARRGTGEEKPRDLESGVMTYFKTKDPITDQEVFDKDGFTSFNRFRSESGEKDANVALADFESFRGMSPQKKAAFVLRQDPKNALKYFSMMTAEDNAELDKLTKG